MRRRARSTSSPASRSIAMYGLPELGSIPASVTCAMCCDSIAPLAIASRAKRSTTSGRFESDAVARTFTATRRPVRRWRAS